MNFAEKGTHRIFHNNCGKYFFIRHRFCRRSGERRGMTNTEVQINQISTGQQFTLHLDDDITIRQLKEQVFSQEGIPVDVQLLFTSDKICLNNKKILDTSLLTLVEKNEKNIIELNMFYNLDGGNFTIDLFCCGCFSKDGEHLICCLGFGCGAAEKHCICEIFFSRCKIPCSIM